MRVDNIYVSTLIGFASLSHSKSTLSIGTLGVAYELFQWPLWTGRVLWGISKLREFMCFLGIAWGYGFEGTRTLQPARESFSQPGRNSSWPGNNGSQPSRKQRVEG